MANGWHRANKNTPAVRARQAEYNTTEYKRAKQAARRQVQAGTAYCWRPDCRRWIPPGSNWHLGHDDQRRIRGPEHAACNLHHAAIAGAATVNRTNHPRPRPRRPLNW